MSEDRFDTHLICNARSPLIAGGKLRDEVLLYNLSTESTADVNDRFAELTGKRIGLESETATLSGGQKVLLMCLLALYSPAPRILFVDLWHSLDEQNKTIVRRLLTEAGTAKEILSESSDAED
ncbi:MAG: hypothetical protein K0B87_04820 [Candidatus Syntrophosphaera sp.]|nr:hypothetical protein [Candidatus Syntrophosphaera sp.]